MGVSVLLLFIIVISGCVQQPEEKTEKISSSNKNSVELLTGVSLSPKSFQANDFTNFFEQAKEAGEVVMWAGDWNELSNAQGGGSVVVASLAQTYKYVPVVELQFFTQSDGKLLRPLDEVTKQNYKNSLIVFIKKYQPEYLGIGIEVNTLYEKSPADFDVFSQFFSEVYDLVKANSPNTKVFTIFQLEKMKGLNGGLFGGTNDPNKAQWFLLDKFPKSDIIAFTTYPGLIYKNPSDIPSNYYTEIQTHTSKNIAFTEIGWHSGASPKGWESSEEEQAEFVAKLSELSRDLNKELVLWSFMYDQETFEPFNSMGLRRRDDGTVKLAWNEWLKINGIREKD